MKYAIVLMLGLSLAACGADGEPVTPNYHAVVNVGPHGVNTNAGVTLTKGPFKLGWNIF